MKNLSELEARYIVLKIKDLESLPDGQRQMIEMTLGEIGRIVDKHRDSQGKELFRALVVEADWPEYPVVLSAILGRADREQAIRDEEERRRKELEDDDGIPF